MKRGKSFVFQWDLDRETLMFDTSSQYAILAEGF